jgi:hypothetical protein
MEKNEMLVKAQALCNEVYHAGEVNLLPCVFFEKLKEDAIIATEKGTGPGNYCAYYVGHNDRYHTIRLTELVQEYPWEDCAEIVLHEIAHACHQEMVENNGLEFSDPDQYHNEIWQTLFEDLKFLFLPKRGEGKEA